MPVVEVEEVCLIDTETNEEYKIIVSSNDAIKTRNDKKTIL